MKIKGIEKRETWSLSLFPKLSYDKSEQKFYKIYYTLFNTPDFCSYKLLKLNMKSWNSFLKIRVSVVRIRPWAPLFPF